MGEEEKKQPAEPEKKDEAAKGEKPVEEDGKKEEKKSEGELPPPPPPPEIVLRVFMHCEGCARKVRRCLKGFEGVEEVTTDCRTSKVVVRGEKADPVKVVERVQKKSHRQVELISPIPAAEEDPPKPPEKELPKPQETKQEAPVITVVLGVYMHCEACAQGIKKRIQRMKGVESAEADLKTSQVITKGVFEPEKLVEHVYKRTGKHATIIKVEPEKKEEKESEEKKADDEGKKESKNDGGKQEDNKEEGAGTVSGGGEPLAAEAEAEGEDFKMELRKNESTFYEYPHNNNYHQFLYPQRFVQETVDYPPQMFSDENPNACSVM